MKVRLVYPSISPDISVIGKHIPRSPHSSLPVGHRRVLSKPQIVKEQPVLVHGQTGHASIMYVHV